MTPDQLRTIVTFESTAFNMTVPREYFINPCCFGDDLAEWIISELRKAGFKTDDKPGQEDFGWYLHFDVAGIGHTLVIGHLPKGQSEAGPWIGWLERKRGFVLSIFGWRKRGIQASAAQAIHRILSGTSLITNVRWHSPRDFDPQDFDSGREKGSASPQ